MNRRIIALPALFIVLASFSLRLNVAEPSAAYGLYLSKDQGRSWSKADTGLRRDVRINALASFKNSIVAGTDGGIFISTNAAKSWRAATIDGLPGARITSLASFGSRVFAGSSQGVLLASSDNGLNWQTNQTFPRRVIRSLHALEGTLYVGTDADYVYGSSDQGKRWTQLSAGLPPHAQVSALTSVGGRLFVGLYAQGLYRWDGEQWNRIGTSAHIKPLALAAFGQTLVAGHNPGGIYWSDDLGQNWKRWSLAAGSTPGNNADPDPFFPSIDSILNNAAPATLPTLQAPIWEMTADSKIAIAGAGSGIYYSTDGARTWIRATNGLRAAPGIAFLIQDNFILAAVHEKTSSCAVEPK